MNRNIEDPNVYTETRDSHIEAVGADSVDTAAERMMFFVVKQEPASETLSTAPNTQIDVDEHQSDVKEEQDLFFEVPRRCPELDGEIWKTEPEQYENEYSAVDMEFESQTTLVKNEWTCGDGPLYECDGEDVRSDLKVETAHHELEIKRHPASGACVLQLDGTQRSDVKEERDVLCEGRTRRDGSVRGSDTSNDQTDTKPEPNESKYECGADTQLETQTISAQHMSRTEEKTNECEHCGKRFVLLSNLSKHNVVVHDGTERHYCDLCNAGFDDKTYLARHILSIHIKKSPFVCTQCRKVFKKKSSLERHSSVRHGINLYCCEACEKTFVHKRLFSNHVKRHTSVRPYRCKSCKRSFKTKRALEAHENAHTQANRFECGICGKQFGTKTGMKRHIDNHVGSSWQNEIFECEICSKRCTSKNTLKRHADTHDVVVYECTVCPKTFTSLHQFRKHENFHAECVPNALYLFTSRMPSRFH